MEAAFPEAFASKIKEAVNKIKHKKNPTLIIAIDSHGNTECVGRQHKPYIAYDDLVDEIINNSFKISNKITVMLFLDTCHSGSIIPVIKTKLACSSENKEKCFSGIDGQKYESKIIVYTASQSEDFSFGSELWEIIATINSLPDCKDEFCGFNDLGEATFLALDYRMSNSLWNSFKGKKEDLLTTATNGKNAVGDKKTIQDLIKSIKINTDYHFRIRSINTLANIANGDKDAISFLINIFKNETLLVVRQHAAIALGKIAKCDKDAIVTLLEILKNDSSISIRKRAIETLGEIAENDEETINYLLYIFENDDSGTVGSYAAEALGNIGVGNKNLITVFMRQLKNPKINEEDRLYVGDALGKIAKGDKNTIADLIDLFKNADLGIKVYAIYSLGLIAKGDKDAITALIDILKNSIDDYLVCIAAKDALVEIAKGDKEAETALKTYKCSTGIILNK